MSTTSAQKKHKLTVEVTPELLQAARIKSALTGRPMAEVMRQALAEWAKEGEELLKQARN